VHDGANHPERAFPFFFGVAITTITNIMSIIILQSNKKKEEKGKNE